MRGCVLASVMASLLVSLYSNACSAVVAIYVMGMPPKKQASKAAYAAALKQAWTEATEKHHPPVTPEQKARREAAARKNQELLARLRARFESD